MTYDELLKLAREAGFPDWWLTSTDKRSEAMLLRLKRFAELVREKT